MNFEQQTRQTILMKVLFKKIHFVNIFFRMEQSSLMQNMAANLSFCWFLIQTFDCINFYYNYDWFDLYSNNIEMIPKLSGYYASVVYS